MVAVTPTALLADSGGAMLYGKGPVLLNGKLLPRSSAIFPGDLVQTQSESIATLDASGSGVTVLPDSLIKFEANAVSLQHGSVSVGTSRGMVATLRDVTVTPASEKWTEYELADTNGMVRIFANKSDVNVNCGKSVTTLLEGEEAIPDGSGKCKKKRGMGGGAPMPGHGGILTNPYVAVGGLVSGGLLACLLLCTSSKPFVSQFKP